MIVNNSYKWSLNTTFFRNNIFLKKRGGDIYMQCCLTKEVIIFDRFNIGFKKEVPFRQVRQNCD